MSMNINLNFAHTQILSHAWLHLTLANGEGKPWYCSVLSSPSCFCTSDSCLLSSNSEGEPLLCVGASSPKSPWDSRMNKSRICYILPKTCWHIGTLWKQGYHFPTNIHRSWALWACWHLKCEIFGVLSPCGWEFNSLYMCSCRSFVHIFFTTW